MLCSDNAPELDLVPNLEESFLSFVLLFLVAVVCTVIVEFYVGCNGKERAFVIEKMNIVKNKILKNDKDQ